MANPQTSERLTRERFHELLLAYMGAVHHAEWARQQYGTGLPEYKVALDAATRALQELGKAVFP